LGFSIATVAVELGCVAGTRPEEEKKEKRQYEDNEYRKRSCQLGKEERE
jgi:hypothetical protein